MTGNLLYVYGRVFHLVEKRRIKEGTKNNVGGAIMEYLGTDGKWRNKSQLVTEFGISYTAIKYRMTKHGWRSPRVFEELDNSRGNKEFRELGNQPRPARFSATPFGL